MDASDTIVNRVAESGIITLDLADYYPKGKRVEFDLGTLLYEGLVLKEKDFREFVKLHDWSQYRDQYVALTCSTDAIIPVWAFMLVEVNLQPYVKRSVLGTIDILETILFSESLARIDPEAFRDQRVMVKGCSDREVPPSAYVEITRLLKPVVKTLMFGEACSAVPLFKKP